MRNRTAALNKCFHDISIGNTHKYFSTIHIPYLPEIRVIKKVTNSGLWIELKLTNKGETPSNVKSLEHWHKLFSIVIMGASVIFLYYVLFSGFIVAFDQYY